MSFSSKVGPKPAEIKYERHPVSIYFIEFNQYLIPWQTLVTPQHTPPTLNRQSQQPLGQNPPQSFGTHAPQQPPQPYTQNFGQGPPVGPHQLTERGVTGSPQQPHFPPSGHGGPPQLPQQFSSAPPPQPLHQNHNKAAHSADLPPLKPVFGMSLDELFVRDGSAVPLIVYQCLQAVDLFGLEVEGIYRLSGTASHVMRIKAMFDNGMLRPFSVITGG